MTINDYYLQELNSLRKLGEEFARKNPGLAPYLAKEGQDPDVERMLEGFAFLTGRLKQQLDEELPEVAHNMTQLLWPNFIKPIPSYCIVSYEPLSLENTPQIVPKGTHLASRSNDKGLQFKFQTCYETVVHPLKLATCKYNIFGKKSSLAIGFEMSTKDNLNILNLDFLRLYLNGSKFLSQELYLYVLQYVESIELEIIDANDETVKSFYLEKNCVTPVGFEKNEQMISHPQNVFDGYVVLQEFFSFEHKYYFVDVNGLRKIFNESEQVLSENRKFILRFNFSKRLHSVQTISIDDFALYCTPAINLFETDAIPVRKSALNQEYLLTPSEYDRQECEIFSVLNVRGWMQSKNRYENFLPFESFDHKNDEEYYSIRVALSNEGHKTKSYIRFSSAQGIYEKNTHNNNAVSIKMLCTNHSLPSTLKLGEICKNVEQSGVSHLKFQNITIPTRSYPPPLKEDFLWRVISNMSLNYLSLSDESNLKEILKTYDFPGAFDATIAKKNSVMLEGIKSIGYENTTMIYKGYPIQGIYTKLQLDVSKFTGMGEAYLFCSVLNEFFALYNNINSFHILQVDIENEGSFRWQPKMGYQQVM
jgi:type VI secretion system protein ImpG